LFAFLLCRRCLNTKIGGGATRSHGHAKIHVSMINGLSIILIIVVILLSINSKRNRKQLAIEKYYGKIVKLIDDIENAQMKARITMNY